MPHVRPTDLDIAEAPPGSPSSSMVAVMVSYNKSAACSTILYHDLVNIFDE
jgi:hypothetical protein